MLRIDGHQSGILSDRYFDIIIGDWKATLLLIVQAPLIAAAVAGVWANVKTDTMTLYFVLCLSAFFLGAINSCREIVKERALFLREKMFNLNVGAYLVSKYRVQAILIVLQCAILAGGVRVALPIKVNLLGLAGVLLAVAFTGTAVGLLLSSWVKSADKAVGLVPLVVIPQILFSDFVLGEGQLSNWTANAQKVMPVHWGYEILKTLRANEIEWMTIVGGAGVLFVISGVCFFLSLVRLAQSRY